METSGLLRSKTTATFGGRQWRFYKRNGLKQTTIEIVPLAGGPAVATYTVASFRQNGQLRLGQTQLRFKVHTWKSHYSWLDAKGDMLAELRLNGWFKRGGQLECQAALLRSPHYELILPLSLYLAFDAEEASAAAGGVAASSAAVASS